MRDSSDTNWDDFDGDSLEILQAWEDHLATSELHKDNLYSEVIADVTDEFGDNAILQLYLAYEDVMGDMCELYRPNLPFSENLVEEIAEAILQKLAHTGMVDYVELIPVSNLSSDRGKHSRELYFF